MSESESDLVTLCRGCAHAKFLPGERKTVCTLPADQRAQRARRQIGWLAASLNEFVDAELNNNREEAMEASSEIMEIYDQLKGTLTRFDAATNLGYSDPEPGVIKACNTHNQQVMLHDRETVETYNAAANKTAELDKKLRDFEEATSREKKNEAD